MATPKVVALAALVAVSAFLAVSTLEAQRETSETLIARGGFATLRGNDDGDGSLVYLPPGTRLEPIGSGEANDALAYLTETGLIVSVHRGGLLGDAEQRAIRSTVGRDIGFVLANTVAPVEIGGAQRAVELVAGTPYRAFPATDQKAVLAVDLCDSLWREIRACGDAAGLPLMRPIRMMLDEIALFDLDRLKSQRMRAPGAMSRLAAAGADRLERACGAGALMAVGSIDTAAGNAPALPSAELFLARLQIDYETELATVAAFGPGRGVRLVYAARSDGRPRRLALVRSCTTGQIEQASFRDASGAEFVIDSTRVNRMGLDPAADRFVAACPRAQIELARELHGEGLSPEDAAWFLAQTVRWHLDRPCAPPQG